MSTILPTLCTVGSILTFVWMFPFVVRGAAHPDAFAPTLLICAVILVVEIALLLQGCACRNPACALFVTSLFQLRFLIVNYMTGVSLTYLQCHVNVSVVYVMLTAHVALRSLYERCCAFTAEPSLTAGDVIMDDAESGEYVSESESVTGGEGVELCETVMHAGMHAGDVGGVGDVGGAGDAGDVGNVGNNIVCEICYELLCDEYSRAFPCAHVFHDRCISARMVICPSCPVCETFVTYRV
jgi:hypothetical protein